MALMDAILMQFDDLGVEPSELVLEKCVELCNEYGITDAVEFVEGWMAFSVTHLDGAEPSVEHLCEMERKELAHWHHVKATNNKFTTNKHQQDNLSNYDNFPDDDIIDCYGFSTPKAVKPQSSLHRAAVENSISSSPATFSPISGLNKSTSDTSGKVTHTFGSALLLNNTKWDTPHKQDIIITQIPCNENDCCLSATNANYMFDPLVEKCLAARDNLYGIAKEIYLKQFNSVALNENENDNEFEREPFSDLSHPNVPFPQAIKCLGRICTDNEGKLDTSSTLLIGTDDTKLRSVHLNFSRTTSFAVIPGQVVMVEGVNPRGDILYVNDIIADIALNTSKHPQLTEPLSIVIASGPFSSIDDVLYEPIHELIQYCQLNKPNVLIINGPFVDADNRAINKGKLLESFDAFFDKMIHGIMAAIGDDTYVVAISSSRDLTSNMVYPTHPNKLSRTYKNFSMLPDPCMININGLIVGITSTDVITHISEAELAIGVPDKIKRCVNYMFNQKSFYPMNPPSIDVCLDTELAAKYAQLNQVPNMLIVPGDTKQFIRDINNCLVINPGRMAPINGCGSFARVFVSQSDSTETVDTPLSNYAACQIIRV